MPGVRSFLCYLRIRDEKKANILKGILGNNDFYMYLNIQDPVF